MKSLKEILLQTLELFILIIIGICILGFIGSIFLISILLFSIKIIYGIGGILISLYLTSLIIVLLMNLKEENKNDI